jgi:pimeloyl-ACP methyl ester carboxylesterase
LPTGAATVVGHSIGGASLLLACALEAAFSAADQRRIGRAIVIDSWLRFPDHDPVPVPFRMGARRAYPDYRAARARFRLSPPEPGSLPELLDHVAHHSLREVAEGWSWRFDPNLPFAPIEPDGRALLRKIDIPVDVIYGERSTVVSAWRAAETVASLPHGRGPIMIPNAFHHIMLDQPTALLGALRKLLS